MSYFPFFIELAHKTGLVVGGGVVALRKAEKLLPYGCTLRVVAPHFVPELRRMPTLELVCRSFADADLTPAPAFVVAATDDKELNARVAALCRAAHIPVNVVDCAQECTFLFPCLVQRGNLSVGISTAGASPTAAIYWKKQFEALLPAQTAEILSWLSAQRPAAKVDFATEAERKPYFQALFTEALRLGRPLTEAETEALRQNAAPGKVWLVGAGCGAADLITVRGLRLLRRCDAVVYDDLIDPALLEEVPAAARRCPVGKRAGRPSPTQEEINTLLVTLVQQGCRCVVRLKGGDPYLFGRGGEEMLALHQAGIEAEEVPGVPSAIGIPAQYHIPVTHRRTSRGVYIVTAHQTDTADGLPEDLPRLAKLHGTLVFLMGLGQLPRLAQALMQEGMPPETPAAVLSGGNSPHPACVRGTLADIAVKVREAGVQPPAVIVVGAVAEMEV